MTKTKKRRIAFLLIAAIVLVGCSTDILTGGTRRDTNHSGAMGRWRIDDTIFRTKC